MEYTKTKDGLTINIVTRAGEYQENAKKYVVNMCSGKKCYISKMAVITPKVYGNILVLIRWRKSIIFRLQCHIVSIVFLIKKTNKRSKENGRKNFSTE